MNMALRKLSLKELKSLLPCIVLILVILFLQPAYAKPIHRRIMENSSDNGVDNVDFIQITNDKKCQILNNVLTILGFERYQKLLNQKILNEVNNYTNKTSHLDHLAYHREWIRHHNEVLYPKSGRLPFDDYHVEPPDEVVSHLYREDITTEEKSVNELINIYERFKLILNGIQRIIKAKEDDGNDNIEHDPDVMGYFKSQEKKIMELLKEIEMGLGKLPEINVNNIIIEYKNDVFDWITIREYLKLIVYTQKAFNILLENCPEPKI